MKFEKHHRCQEQESVVPIEIRRYILSFVLNNCVAQYRPNGGEMRFAINYFLQKDWYLAHSTNVHTKATTCGTAINFSADINWNRSVAIWTRGSYRWSSFTTISSRFLVLLVPLKRNSLFGFEHRKAFISNLMHQSTEIMGIRRVLLITH